MHSNIDPFAVKQKENRTYLTIGLVLLVVAVLFGLLGSGMLGLGRGAGGPVTRAAGKGTGAALPATGASGTAVTAAGRGSGPVTADPKAVMQMPPDIMAWLRHLERCEKRKGELCQMQLTEAGVLKKFAEIGGIRSGDFEDPEKFLDKEPGQKEQAVVEGFEEKWRALIEFYHSVPPPQRCVAAANAYNQHVSEVRNYMIAISKIFDAIGNDMGDSDKMKAHLDECRRMIDTNKNSIDVPGTETDKQVQAICDEYEVRKWFSIKGDVGGGIGDLLTGLLGR